MPPPNVFLTPEDVGAKTSSKTGNPVIPIIVLLMKSIHDAHITHLMQPDKTLALHTAMEKYYDGSIEDLVDDLCEVSMGIYPVTDMKVESSSKITNPVEYFSNLMSQIETLRKPIKESYLQNMIDTACEEIAHTLYRLKNITD